MYHEPAQVYHDSRKVPAAESRRNWVGQWKGAERILNDESASQPGDPLNVDLVSLDVLFDWSWTRI